MAYSIFLAHVIGWYCVIMGLFLLFRRDQVGVIAKDVLAHRGLVVIAAVMTFILGLLLVFSHNIWVAAWPVVITVIAWLTLIAGVVRLFFPEELTRVWRKWLSNPSAIIITAAITLIVGFYLLFIVYYIK